ncbi:MAG: tyrosine--tRNA ligase, partial [Planctomycetota bacterium]|nr:tyrosine--tRNA ligase [Planctomycetota bacterium]
NLVPIILLRHVQLAGHTPVVLMGGGTGLIGDPSGKSAERQLMSREQVEANVASQRRIFERVLDFSKGIANAPVVVNNADWLTKLGYIEVLRDVGKHFSVNAMIQKDSVKSRLESRDQGISYTEFSYMLLQGYDFLHLFREHGVTVQMGGSDQWGNMVGGIDLIRRATQGESFGLTAPLVTKADGGKFGKTEAGAVWLTAERTSPYAFYQFWVNADDADVKRWLRIFTLLGREEIEGLERAHDAAPGAREAHRALAFHATALVHGESEAARAKAASEALFSGEVMGLDLATLEEVFAEAPSSEHAKSELEGEGMGMVELLAATSLAKSKREAREFLSSGAVSVNGEKVGVEGRLTSGNLLHGSVALLRRGRKSWHVARFREGGGGEGGGKGKMRGNFVASGVGKMENCGINQRAARSTRPVCQRASGPTPSGVSPGIGRIARGRRPSCPALTGSFKRSARRGGATFAS